MWLFCQDAPPIYFVLPWSGNNIQYLVQIITLLDTHLIPASFHCAHLKSNFLLQNPTLKNHQPMFCPYRERKFFAFPFARARKWRQMTYLGKQRQFSNWVLILKRYTWKFYVSKPPVTCIVRKLDKSPENRHGNNTKYGSIKHCCENYREGPSRL